MTAPGLLLLLALVHLAPVHIAAALGQSAPAWDYVAFGVESSVLWAVVAATVRSPLVWPLAAWGIAEGAQRSACRLLLPMDSRPELAPGQQLCEAAFGWPWGIAGLWLAVVVAQYMHLRGNGNGRK